MDKVFKLIGPDKVCIQHPGGVQTEYTTKQLEQRIKTLGGFNLGATIEIDAHTALIDAAQQAFKESKYGKK